MLSTQILDEFLESTFVQVQHIAQASNQTIWFSSFYTGSHFSDSELTVTLFQLIPDKVKDFWKNTDSCSVIVAFALPYNSRIIAFDFHLQKCNFSHKSMIDCRFVLTTAARCKHHCVSVETLIYTCPPQHYICAVYCHYGRDTTNINSQYVSMNATRVH